MSRWMKTILKGKNAFLSYTGDARDVLKYKWSDKYIFSESQYLSSLKTNHPLLNLLKMI